MRGRLTRLTVYSASHFLVDFGCALLIFRTVSAGTSKTTLQNAVSFLQRVWNDIL